MMTLILHGKLGEKFPHPVTGRTWRLAARSVAEALHAIDVQMKGFFRYIQELESEMQGYRIQVGEHTIGEDLLWMDAANDVVTITPVLQAGDEKAALEIVAGVAIIALGIATYGGAFGALGALGGAHLLGVEVVGLGLAVSLGGVARLLVNAPPTTLATQDKTRSSYIFTGPVNTIQQGECVPVLYGEAIIGSAVVDAAIESIDVQTTP